MSDDNNQNDENVQQEGVTIEQLQADLDQAMNGWKRAQADFENYRRRTEEQSQELISFAKETVITRLLPTLDALEQALKHFPRYWERGDDGPENSNREFASKYQNWQQGVSGIVTQLDKALEELGVKKIEAVGKKFDPYFHEAIREVAGDEDGIVTEEYQAGFELNGKVIRPSQVAISKKQA
jgi:molecular chaperone GrpE